MIDYQVAIGSTYPALREEVNKLLNNGYQLTGTLAVVSHRDSQGDYSMFYQPMIRHGIEERPRNPVTP